MAVSRARTRTAALAGVLPLLLAVAAAGPAAAHGAPTDPVGRVVACSPQGGAQARSAACRAARAAGGSAFAAWDDLRVAGVAGRDRRVIPDGRLCSGGLDAYRGLDLARADWPSTRLRAGGRLTLRYASTIPHTGTFELYLTKDGYDPSKPLNWSDLDTRPFATATDPALEDGAYRVAAKLPAGRTGHHLLYTIWRNTSTPDTYYSCSDVVLAGSGDAGGGTAERTAPAASASPRPPSPSPSGTPASGAASGSPSPDGTGTVAGEPAAAADRTTLPLVAGAGAGVLLLAAAAFALRRR
ncbi:lytic polysaccharide monooxygenase [Streptomyces minutiscleroticus]|uniref:lytic polysaccharide monooxygenase n=1 Tax=Streptomyces minutiscleroticus TaxID=68238 RepID=UPI00332CD851